MPWPNSVLCNFRWFYIRKHRSHETEQKELKTIIAALATLLKSEENIKAQVATELTAVGKAFAVPRRTKILQ